MQRRWPELNRSALKTGWWVVAPTAILVLAMLLLSGFISVAAASELDAPVAQPVTQRADLLA